MSAYTLAFRSYSLAIHLPLNGHLSKATSDALPRRHAAKDPRPPAAASSKPSFPLTSSRRFTSHGILASENRTPYCLGPPQDFQEEEEKEFPEADDGSSSKSRALVLGAATLGLALLFIGADGSKEALALGPEGPLVEEFWDNVRRYGLYMLTVSTGVAYAVLQPLVELLKNPISAILVIVILVGSGFLLSQILSLMFGLGDFNYQYAS